METNGNQWKLMETNYTQLTDPQREKKYFRKIGISCRAVAVERGAASRGVVIIQPNSLTPLYLHNAHAPRASAGSRGQGQGSVTCSVSKVRVCIIIGHYLSIEYTTYILYKNNEFYT